MRFAPFNLEDIEKAIERSSKIATVNGDILRMLLSPGGVTIGQIKNLTGLKERDARDLLRRVSEKEAGLKLTSSIDSFGERVYRIKK